MRSFGERRGLDDYQFSDLPSLVDGGNPHQLVQLMLDGALTRVAHAQGSLEAGDVPRKCEMISKALNIVEGLRLCLDEEQGGDIARNLSALYDYIARRLVTANANNDSQILTEVISLLRELQTGWRELGELLNAAAAAEPSAAAV